MPDPLNRWILAAALALAALLVAADHTTHTPRPEAAQKAE